MTDESVETDTLTFEELCRSHLQKFAKGSQRYASQTNLTRRVDAWQERLAPILQDEETRPEFDMTIYGRKVISSLENEIAQRRKGHNDENEMIPVMVDFGTVTHDCPRYEVCRRFLSSLSLSNAGNVELGRASLNHLEMKLLHSNLDLPMESFQASSLLP